ncbi:MAG: DegT/DnrJ/EryC1/StrS family aminotransferase [Calditrichaceae bacterium]|nr:DegT/DnrJ/EryC1/StrS family aminotransferase [Calditrichaceae bacterium]
MKIPFLDLKLQYEDIKDEIDQAIAGVINKSAFIGGEYVKKFEENFAKFIGTSHCVSCANGTDALIIALKALGIGRGDEVIIPAISFIATSEAVTAAGAKVVYVDVDEKHNLIDPDKIEDKITQKTKAIIPVHIYGRPADMDRILKIASKHNLKIIEDAAQSHGARYKGRMIGTMGHAACFSFYPGKNLGAYGDGGAIVTLDDALARTMKMYANHGRITKYDHEFEGINSRLDGLQAAVLSVKLKHLNDWNKNRNRIAHDYIAKLETIKGIDTPEKDDNTISVFHLFVIRTDGRDKLSEHLKSKEISTGVHYPIALPFLKAYQYLGHSESDFPIAAKNQNRVLSLPIFPEMTDDQLSYVVRQIQEFKSK